MGSSTLLSALALFAAGIAAVPYEEYIYAPSSRTLHPQSVLRTNGTVTNAEGITTNGTSAGFHGVSSVAYDFGYNIAGVASFRVSSVSGDDEYVGITFAESAAFITEQWSDTTAGQGHDVALWFHITGPDEYKVDRDHERGGFRYLMLYHNSTGDVGIDELTIDYTPMPHWDNLKDYSGYFHCNDDLLNKIWYAGAYTNQICTIDSNHGDAVINGHNVSDPSPDAIIDWYNRGKIANGSTALVDGAKRDRLVWPGDMSIAVPAVAVSTFDMITIRNSLDSLFVLQTSDGQLPYAGTPLPSTYSATYHLYSLIGMANYYLYTGDMEYLMSYWDQFKLAISFSLGFIDSNGLMNVTSASDWLRFYMGGQNIEANAILYHTLNLAIQTAQQLNDSASVSDWTNTAAGIKSAANSILWNEDVGLYNDNETTTALQPQDGNSWAIVANLTDSEDKVTRISQNLAGRWTEFGAPAPEAADAISPFISSFELQAHFLASNASAALELMRRQWGYMLQNENMTQSTFIEGYSTDGSLHYAPYSEDSRISHAHGWSTGPTSVLSDFVAGIKILEASGSSWEISPQLGDLTEVDCGFSTDLGLFAVKIQVEDAKASLSIETPTGTGGTIIFPDVGCKDDTATYSKGGAPGIEGGLSQDVQGGKWDVTCDLA